MESQQLPLPPEHCMEKTHRENLQGELQRQKNSKCMSSLQVTYRPLIVSNTFVLYLILHNDIYCERPV